MRPAGAALIAAGLALACGLALAGCGSGDSSSEGASGTPTTAATAPPGTLEALWRAPGPDVAVVAGTSDFAPGRNRVSFLIVDKQSRLVERPTARVWLARGLRQKPFQQTVARLEPVGVQGGVKGDAQSIYVTHVDTPAPGTYWLLAEPVGGRRVQALGNVVVKKQSAAPAVGDPAVAIANPTVSGGHAARTITTARPPDIDLLRTSVKQALAAKRPFVVTFATPLYCQSRTCGPVVQVVQQAAERWRGKGVDFIHVEIYQGNDPAQGTNRWVDAWGLPTEPFTFVVDRSGVIRTKLEGAFSASELDTAIAKVVT